jgi:hypothetical protein
MLERNSIVARDPGVLARIVHDRQARRSRLLRLDYRGLMRDALAFF